MHRCDDIIASISCKTGLVVSADWPFLGCCAMCTAAQKGPLCGHENGCPGPVFACNECDDIIALVDEKNRMQIGLESAKWHGPPAVLPVRACPHAGWAYTHMYGQVTRALWCAAPARITAVCLVIYLAIPYRQCMNAWYGLVEPVAHTTKTHPVGEAPRPSQFALGDLPRLILTAFRAAYT